MNRKNNIALQDHENLDIKPDIKDVCEEILHGLKQKSPCLSPKFFYDEKGSALFDEITKLDEYYPTRTEKLLLTTYSSEISQCIGKQSVLIEPGAGSCEKARLLLPQLDVAAYVPIDISDEYLKPVAEALALDFPSLQILSFSADYTHELPDVALLPSGHKTVFFPGSTIGNSEPESAKNLLTRFRQMIGDHGGLLIGVDMKKDEAVLNSAYNDAKGITAAFNLNILQNINNITGSNFDLNHWKHMAFYNADKGRVEMHLQSNCDQIVMLSGHRLEFHKDTRIHTENSYKYTPDEFISLAKAAGFHLQQDWSDENNWFRLFYFKT